MTPESPHEFMERQPAFGERLPVARPVEPIDTGKYPTVEDVFPNHRTMSRGQLLQALDNELHDLRIVARNASKVYDHVTGGKISKPMTDPAVVCAMADDECTECVEGDLRELQQEVGKLQEAHRLRVEKMDHEKGEMRSRIREALEHLEFGRDGDAIGALEKVTGKLT